MFIAVAVPYGPQVEGARHVHTEELRLNMDIAIGRAPPLSDGQMQRRLQQEARHLVDEFRDHNKKVVESPSAMFDADTTNIRN